MESDIAAATSYAERVRTAIQGNPVLLEDGRRISLTLSLGCTILDAGDHDVQDAIDRADGALYAAKTSGRNRVRVTVPESSTAVGD
jgi:diguanylate cyclase (GGDEF)-like protein